jgi:hypothetical protein
MGSHGEERNGRAVRLAFRVYKTVLSPVLHAISPSRCLYLPTCSEYAYTAISRFGLARGSWLALRRLSRCHPWGKGGLDPVPVRASPARPRRALSDSSGDVLMGSNQTSADQTHADHLP